VDEKGLFLLVNAVGKHWRLAYRFGGKQKTLAPSPDGLSQKRGMFIAVGVGAPCDGDCVNYSLPSAPG
jgi:hypothetical protein